MVVRLQFSSALCIAHGRVLPWDACVCTHTHTHAHTHVHTQFFLKLHTLWIIVITINVSMFSSMYNSNNCSVVTLTTVIKRNTWRDDETRDGADQECCLFIYISSINTWFHLSQQTGWFTGFIWLFTHLSNFQGGFREWRVVAFTPVCLRGTVWLLYIIVIV